MLIFERRQFVAPTGKLSNSWFSLQAVLQDGFCFSLALHYLSGSLLATGESVSVKGRLSMWESQPEPRPELAAMCWWKTRRGRAQTASVSLWLFLNLVRPTNQIRLREFDGEEDSAEESWLIEIRRKALSDGDRPSMWHCQQTAAQVKRRTGKTTAQVEHTHLWTVPLREPVLLFVAASLPCALLLFSST